MSVISARLARSGISAMREAGDPKDPQLVSEYAAEFVVLCDSASDNQVTILRHFAQNSSLPYFGRIFDLNGERDSGAICRKLRPVFQERSADPWIWRVAVDYQPQDNQGAGSKPPQPPPKGDSNPFNEADEYSIDPTTISVPVEKARYITGFTGDAAGRRKPGTVGPVHNSAWVTYDPPLEDELTLRTLTITRSIAEYADLEWRPFENAVNFTEFSVNRFAYKFSTFADPYQVRYCCARPVQQATPKGDIYWRVSWIFEIHPISWRVDVVDRGFCARAWHGDPNGYGGSYSPGDFQTGMPQIRPLTDANGIPISEPVLLNGDGQPLSQGADPVYLTYAKKNEIDFGPLMAKIFGA